MTPYARFIFVLLFFSFFSLSAQQHYIFEIDSLIGVKNPRLFNGVILIAKNGKVEYSKAKGFRNIHQPVPLRFDDQFEIMSNTKQITAALILREVEKGKIDLQAPIRKYLPDLTRSWADSVTVHQLMNHTQGITDFNKPLAFQPGTDFRYGNLSNILLGKIIEQVSGESYREAATRLFRQLGMKDTFCYAKENPQRLVTGHIVENNVFSSVEESQINEENLPADGVVTTARDLSIWNTKLHHGKVLSPEMYKLMTRPSALSQHDVFGKNKMGYGYNIRIISDQNIQYFGHTGLGDGFASLNIYIPQSDVTLIVLENQMNANSDLYYYFETEIKNLLLKSDLIRQ